ncbi:MAG: hypothetical protein AAGE80_02575 [Pseudomonadota bacterium]
MPSARTLCFALTLLACAASQAQAGHLGCYWNAEGLPYSMEPPEGTAPNPNPSSTSNGPISSPLNYTFAMHMNNPHLILKHGCGIVDERDIVPARELYEGWGCTAQSSLGRMIEGLPRGGAYVSEASTALKHFIDLYRNDLFEYCAITVAADPICFRIRPIVGNDAEIAEINKRQEREHPECLAYWELLEQQWYVDKRFNTKAKANQIVTSDGLLVEPTAAETEELIKLQRASRRLLESAEVKN